MLQTDLLAFLPWAEPRFIFFPLLPRLSPGSELESVHCLLLFLLPSSLVPGRAPPRLPGWLWRRAGSTCLILPPFLTGLDSIDRPSLVLVRTDSRAEDCPDQSRSSCSNPSSPVSLLIISSSNSSVLMTMLIRPSSRSRLCGSLPGIRGFPNPASPSSHHPNPPCNSLFFPPASLHSAISRSTHSHPYRSIHLSPAPLTSSDNHPDTHQSESGHAADAPLSASPSAAEAAAATISCPSSRRSFPTSVAILLRTSTACWPAVRISTASTAGTSGSSRTSGIQSGWGTRDPEWTPPTARVPSRNPERRES